MSITDESGNLGSEIELNEERASLKNEDIPNDEQIPQNILDTTEPGIEGVVNGHEKSENSQVQTMTASRESVQSNKSSRSRKKGSQASIISSGSNNSFNNRNRFTTNLPAFLKDRIQASFVYPLEAKHKCPLCDEVLRYPVGFEECDHRVCAHCFETRIKRNDNQKCPVDQTPIDVDTVFPDEELHEEIIALEVKCLNGEWCKWEGEFHQILEHVDLCEYTEILCANDCGKSYQRRETQKHMDKKCQKKIISCPYCDYRHLREEKKEHMNECLKMPLPCPNKCDKSITFLREELGKHIDDICPKTKLSCDYETIGCDHQCSRDKMAKHTKAELTNHIKLIYDLAMSNRERIDKQDKLMAHHMSLITEANKRIGLLQRVAQNTIIWRIEDYHRKKNQAKSNPKLDTLFSPSFHTSKHGYRLCASICLNGDGKGKGKYISVFVCILKGAYDPLLRWPFDYEVNITLLDQDVKRSNRQHIQCSLKPNPCLENMPFLGQPKLEKNASFGSSMFVAHEDIENKKFLRDETLFIKISIACDENSEP